MYAMQYELTLPGDCDMGIIRTRVATRGHALDDRAGLGLKAYLIRERGVNGSPVNQYAPFYLWHEVGAMAAFLVGGGGFQGIESDFGRPPVHHWTGLALEKGPARENVPLTASRRLTPLPEGTEAHIETEIRELRALAGRAGVHSAALALDPYHWRTVRLVLWERAVPEEETGERYEVLHLSAPHADDLPRGRHW
jgi:hypothetical protein